MGISIYTPITIVFALLIYAAFGWLKRVTKSSAGAELAATHDADRRLAVVDAEAHRASKDRLGHKADDAKMLPSSLEAMIIPLGAPIEREYATFEGSLSDARERVRNMSSTDRQHIAIWTPGHIFGADELIAEVPGHEHDPLAPSYPPPSSGSA